MSRAEGVRAKAEGLSALLAERRRSIERDIAFSVNHDMIASLEAESASLSGQLDAVDRESAELGPAAAEVAAAEARLAAETAAAEDASQEAGLAAADPAAEARGELAALRAALERGHAELRRLDGRVAAVSQRADRVASETARLQRSLAEADEAAPLLKRAADEAAGLLATAEAALVVAEDARRRADEVRHRWSAREEALGQALDEARARAGAQRLSDVMGVVGALLELVELDDGWEAAFEAAAGEFLAAVVVEGLQAARRSLEELHRQAVTGAVAAVPDVPFSTSGPPLPPDLPIGTEPLRSHVRARLLGVNALLDQLLATAVVVPGTWEDAFALARAHPGLVVVTRAGDRYANGLWRAGQGGAGATGAALEEARAAASAANAAAQAAAAAATEAAQETQAAREVLVEAARAVDANNARQSAVADALARAGADAGDARAEADVVAAQQVDIRARLARDEQRAAELEALLPGLEAAAAEEATRQLAARSARARLADQTAAVAALRRDFEVRAAGLDERRSLLLTRKQGVDERLAGNVTERDSAGLRRQRLRGDAMVIERLASLIRDRHDTIESLLAQVRRERREEAEEIRSQTDRLDQLRRECTAAERHLTELRERSSRVDLEETEARVRLQHLTESVRRELDCEPEAVRGAPSPELPPGTSATSRRAELERELRLMGPINPLALEEYAALQERHQFLEGQLEDVRTARRDLAKLIRAIDAEIEDVLRGAWLDVADNFESLFSALFPGGQGRLRLTDPDDMLETGIEIEARPSGKNVRRLSLLSGGERSLVALAFLFAVFRSRPSPFYLMDEVEAALDDVNLHRFLDLVHEFRDEAQLVIVSHQRRTMEAADCLYGVTMPPAGSSRVVTERVEART